MKQLSLLFALLIAGTVQAFSSVNAPSTTQTVLPRASATGIVFTDESGSGIFRAAASGTEILASSPGSGKYFTLSPEGTRIGYKNISVRGQSPCELDLVTGEMKELAPPALRAGQVSFTRSGERAFTLGDSLIVLSTTGRASYFIGTYANIAPISPDGKFVIYNDDDDQLWLFSLTSGTRHCFTDRNAAYGMPQWSPDGLTVLYSSLAGKLSTYSLTGGTTVSLGEGYAPDWNPDGHSIVFYRKEISGDILVNTELYSVSPDGSNLRQLTSTPGNCEMYPSFTLDGNALVFASGKPGEISETSLLQSGLLSNARISTVVDIPVLARQTSSPAIVLSALDVPYINQVFDTPDWFNGHSACAPTAAMTVLAYYAALPRWDVGCSTPMYHLSPWGRYICEQYYFKQFIYASRANDPNGAASFGGFGYMWASGSPYANMASYFTRHGLAAQQTDAPPHSAALYEVQAGYPYSMCVGLTSAGHLIVAHGVGAEPHTLVFNDPYGNKNLKTSLGYPNTEGKNVQYDWPGYNNGNENLTQVYWCIAVHAPVPADADTLVDDLQFDHGFTLSTAYPASMMRWKDMNRGLNGHFWYVKSTGTPDRDTCYAIWRPTLPQAGPYEVFAYVPFSMATGARYRIFSSAGWDTVIVDQKTAPDSTWISLGIRQFDAGNAGYVVLGDGATPAGQEIVFDAMRWSYRGTTALKQEEAVPGSFALLQNFPNPFNPSTSLRYTLPVRANVRMTILNVLGQIVTELTPGSQEAGTHSIVWQANAASGVYFCRLEATASDNSGRSFFAVRKMILAR